MPFPQGGPAQSIAQGFKIVSYDPVLQSPGVSVYLSPNQLQELTFAEVASEITSNFVAYQELNAAQRALLIFRFDTVSVGTRVVSQVPANYTGAYSTVGVYDSFSSFWRMVQFNPGVLPWLPDMYSDLFQYDITGSASAVGRAAIHFASELAPTIFTTDIIDVNKNLVSSNYYTTITGHTDPCIGDETPPLLTLYSPTQSGIHLRPRNQIIDFSLSDSVGGVDLSTVYVTLDSVTTSGVIVLLSNGIDQTGGNVSVTGNASSYRFAYTPPSLWGYNEEVLVTISGSDLPPTVDGNPFYCGAQSVNTLTGNIIFRVLNFEDLTAEINAIGDISPPYISQTFPASGTSNNSVFSPVSFDLNDDLTGVDLSSVDVSVDGIPILNAGAAVTEETVVTGSPNNYTISYTPSSAFSYGSTALVSISAQDKVQPTPNILTSSYTFDLISDSTLVINNFTPGPGTHTDPQDLDITVDITDASFGVDTEQTFFVINGTVVSGTQTAITDGVKLTYHPPNDFAYDEPMQIIVHGVNGNLSAPAVKEVSYSLYYGCRVFIFNDEPYTHLSNVDVFVRARNKEQLYKDLTTGYYFTTYTQPHSNLSATIEAINPQKDISASITAVGPEHRYGETVTVEFSVEDYDGRLLGPYTFTYTIEDSP